MADDEREPMQDVTIDLSISRDAIPKCVEKTIDLTEINNLPVYDQEGNIICFGELYKKQTTIVVFLRVSFFKTETFSPLDLALEAGCPSLPSVALRLVSKRHPTQRVSEGEILLTAYYRISPPGQGLWDRLACTVGT